MHSLHRKLSRREIRELASKHGSSKPIQVMAVSEPEPVCELPSDILGGEQGKLYVSKDFGEARDRRGAIGFYRLS
jgi:hypothetical protein